MQWLALIVLLVALLATYRNLPECIWKVIDCTAEYRCLLALLVLVSLLVEF